MVDLDLEEYRRYGRQMILPEIGKPGQIALKSSAVLVVGAGGLGCPAIAYLAGAGVGCLGIIDADTIDLSNCHRQILHKPDDVGKPKVESAAAFVKELNGSISTRLYPFSLEAGNSVEIFSGYDVVLDCTDNQPARYLISDTCVILGLPLISGAALKTEGQLAVYNYRNGPCYRCLFPVATPAENVQSCGRAGVLGPVVGLIGILQALECIKVLIAQRKGSNSVMLDEYKPSLTLFSAFGSPQWRTIQLRQKKQKCVSCGPAATISQETIRNAKTDYATFCSGGDHLDGRLETHERLEASKLDGNVDKYMILDVRDSTQFGIAHLDHSINVPFTDLQISELSFSEKPILVVCRIGNDSQRAVRALQRRYPRQTFLDLKGGLQDYAAIKNDFPFY